MSRFDTAELSRADLPQWDALIDQSAHGTIFHKSGWLDACAQSLGKKVKIFGCFQDGQSIGGSSLFLQKKLGVVTTANSTCLTTPYGGCGTFFIPKPECSQKGIVFSGNY